MANEDFESQEELGIGGKIKNWIQDNIRIIISVLIVVVIAGGIYSYSNRSQEIVFDEDAELEDEFVIDQDSKGEEDLQEEVVAEKGDSQIQVNQNPADTKVVSEINSQETGDSFIETASVGDSKTTLARKALASYLEKNNDSTLTAEHKIYIEDYLRKNVAYTGGVKVGTEIGFSKNLIKNSIEKAKTLNEKQLKNLEKYSARVSGLK